MKTNKLFFFLAFIGLNATLFAQNNVLPKHEFTINGFGGLSTLLYKVDVGTSTIYKMESVDVKKGLGFAGGGGLGYHYFFNDNWGLVTGLEAALYRASVSADMMESGKYYEIRYGTGEFQEIDEFLINYELGKFKERQNMLALQLPIMAQFLQPIDPQKKHHFFVAFGGRLGYSVMGNYKQSAEKVERCVLYRLYGMDNVFDQLEKTQLEGYEVKKPLKFGGFNVMASIEVGFRWKLAEWLSLYTGIYADYGFLNLIPKMVNEKLITSVDGGEGHPGEFFEYDVNSILVAQNSDYLEPKDPGPQAGRIWEFKQSDDRYVNKLNNLGAGLKIKLAFNAPKVKKEPKPKPAPKPKPEPKPKPAPEPVKEVPQEIKQSMMKLSNTLFAFDKFNLSDEAVVELNKVVKWLVDNPDIKVEIEGHTDNKGSAEYNQKLSEERAKSVYDYFVSHGVKASRLSYKGYGLTRPIAPNSNPDGSDNPSGRQQNRRAELKIIQ